MIYSARNDITGDLLISKTNSENYRQGWDLIFKKVEDIKQNLEDFSEKLAEIDKKDAGKS